MRLVVRKMTLLRCQRLSRQKRPETFAGNPAGSGPNDTRFVVGVSFPLLLEHDQGSTNAAKHARRADTVV